MSKSLTIYPISDISLQHSKSNTSAAGGYALINDVTSDDSEGYILQSLDRTTQSDTSTSEFLCGGTTGKIYITAVSTFIRASAYNSNSNMALETTITPSISINNGSYKSGSEHTLSATTSSGNWQDLTDNITGVSGLNTIYETISDANIKLKIYQNSTTSGSQGKYTTGEASITQANIVVTYLDVFDCSASYIPGTGISTASCSSTEVVDGNTCTFTAVVDNGVEFEGWYSDADCTNLVSNSQTYIATITDNTTLYAKGNIKYSITVYGDDNCTVSTTSTEAIFGASVTITATPNNNRYTIVGWYSNPERTTLVTTDNPYTFNVSGNSVFYAKSKLNQQIYIKVNNVWVVCTAVYKKIDGIWVEQSELDGLFDTSKNYKINEV